MKKIVLILCSFFLIQLACGQTTLREGFESWPLEDWGFFQLGDAIDGWRDTFDGTVHTGNFAAYASINNAQCDNWMVSPAINVVNSNYLLKFWEYSATNDIEFYDSATVLISLGSNDPSSGDFTEVFETELNTDNFEERTIDLSAYDGETIYVAFRYQGTYHGWFIDDVSVGPIAYVDGSLTQVANPTGVSEIPNVFPVVVTIQNTGTTVITDFSILWQVNGVDRPDANYTGLEFQPGQLLNLNLGNYFFDSEGYYDIDAALNLFNDFDSSNDATQGTFEISSFKDGEVVGILPEGIIPNAGNKDITIEIKNSGANTINEAQIEWAIDNVEQPPFTTSSLNLQAGESTVIDLGIFNFDIGLHTISANLNALGDTNESNDTYTANLAVNTFFESFEGNEFPPEGWAIEFGTRDGSNFGNAADGEFYYVSNVDDNYFGVISDSIFTPLLDIEIGDRFQFYIQSSVAQPTNIALVWKNGSTGEINFIQNVPPSPGFANWELRDFDISQATGVNQIGLIITSTGSYGSTKFDSFASDASVHLFDNDLKIRNGDINFLAKQNQSEQYECKIRNSGALSVLGSDYTLKLMEEPGIEIASVSGVDLQSWQETTLTVNVNLANIETKRLYFEIDFALDENTSNNTFRSYAVSVVPVSAEIIDIGSPDQRSGTIPFTPNGNTNSLGEDDLSQSLFYKDEFNTPGYVYGIAYKYDNLLEADVAKGYPLKIWVTQSNVDNLEGGWILEDDLILVFDGVIDILPGNDRDLYIPFDEPILLNGIDNVVIQNYQYNPEWPPSIFRMLTTQLDVSNPIRSIGVFDVFDLDPSSPPEFFATLVDIPFTRFVIDPVTSASVLSGVVYNNTDNSPLQNALVSIAGTSIMSVTDDTGSYSFPELPYGTYEIEIVADTFQSLTQQVQLNSINQNQDFFINPLEEVQLIGRVFGSNNIANPLELVNVLIVQEGNSFGQVTTDANGDFIFPLIYGGFDYELRLTLYGYEEKIIQISPVDSDIDLGDIILEEEFISPFDVQVSEDSDPTVIWKSPKLSAKVKLQHDLNVNSFSYTNEPNENAWLGNYWQLTERTTITSVEIQTDIFQNAEDFVTIDIIDIVEDEILATSEPFIIYRDSIQTINVPNIVVNGIIAVMVHWENNPLSTNSLVVDFSSEDIFNAAVVKFPGQQVNLFSSLLGDGAPNMAFHVRVNTLEDGNPITNGEAVTYNVYRGLASEFPDTSNWELLNGFPVLDLSFIDTNNSAIDPNEFYRYAVETIYANGVSEVTFSNSILGGVLSVNDFQNINSKLSVYPIPTKDNLTIRLDPSLIIETDMVIYDITGKRVSFIRRSVFSNNIAVIDVSQLQRGMYFLKINIDGVSITKKFQVN